MKKKTTNSHPNEEPRIMPTRIPRIPCDAPRDRADKLSTEDAFLAGAASAILLTVAARTLRRVIGRLDKEHVAQVAHTAYAQLGQVLASVVPPNGGA